MAFFFEQAEADDIRGRADGRAIAAETRADQQPECQQIKRRAVRAAEPPPKFRRHRQHDHDVRNIVNKSAQNDRNPDQHRISQKQIVPE